MAIIVTGVAVPHTDPEFIRYQPPAQPLPPPKGSTKLQARGLWALGGLAAIFAIAAIAARAPKGSRR